jgi:hypothetical protein
MMQTNQNTMRINHKLEQWTTLVIPEIHENETYSISNFGRIKSFKCHKCGKIIKNPKLKGYEAIVVKLQNAKNTTKYIHKLVAEHFIVKDNTLQKYVIHKDFNKCNNHVSNLCWVTKQTMFAHQKVNPNYKRGIVSNAKLTEKDVKKLKLKLLKHQNKPSSIAKEFGITHTQLNRIRRGENWAHVKVG